MDGFIAVPILFLNRKVPHGTHFHRDTSRPILQQHSPFIITVNRHHIGTQLHDRINGAFPLLQRFFIRSRNGIHHLLHIFHIILHGIGHLNHRLLAVGHGHLYRCTDVDRHKDQKRQTQNCCNDRAHQARHHRRQRYPPLFLFHAALYPFL